MSRENVEVVRRGFDLWARGDIAAVTELLHPEIEWGGVRFPHTGPARYTMTAAQAVRVARELKLRTLVPIHYEGWKHFRQGRAEVERAFGDAGIDGRVQWLAPAQAQAIPV